MGLIGIFSGGGGADGIVLNEGEMKKIGWGGLLMVSGVDVLERVTRIRAPS